MWGKIESEKNMNKKLIAGSVVLSALGFQYFKDPVMEHEGTQLDMVSSSFVSYPMLVKGSFAGKSNESVLFDEAVEKVNAIYGSECFREEVKNAKFTNTNNLNNDEVYLQFVNHRLLANVSFFYGTFKQNYIWKTVGYVNGDGRIYVNRFYVKSSDKLASNIMHEKAHDVGFRHSSSTEYSSVPYTMNRIFDKCSM